MNDYYFAGGWDQKSLAIFLFHGSTKSLSISQHFTFHVAVCRFFSGCVFCCFRFIIPLGLFTIGCVYQKSKVFVYVQKQGRSWMPAMYRRFWKMHLLSHLKCLGLESIWRNLGVKIMLCIWAVVLFSDSFVCYLMAERRSRAEMSAELELRMAVSLIWHFWLAQYLLLISIHPPIY